MELLWNQLMKLASNVYEGGYIFGLDCSIAWPSVDEGYNGNAGNGWHQHNYGRFHHWLATCGIKKRCGNYCSASAN
jgi:hypothetical protein